MKSLSTTLAAATALGASAIALAQDTACLDQFTDNMAQSTEAFNFRTALCEKITDDPVLENACISYSENIHFAEFETASFELEACHAQRLPIPPGAFD